MKKKDAPKVNFFDGVNKKLIYLLSLSLVIVSTIALSFVHAKGVEPKDAPVALSTPIPTLRPMPKPVFTGTSISPIISAQGALVLEVATNTILFEKNPDTKLLPASTTKIISALVAMDYYKKDDVATVGDRKIEGQKMGLTSGERLYAWDLIEALLVYSANDAAITLAENYPGGEKAFVDAMNRKNEDLGLSDTHFENPVGYDGVGNYTTSRDLVKASVYAVKIPYFADIVSRDHVEIASLETEKNYNLKSTNELLTEVDGVLGVKTGWTENARENLVTYLVRDNRKLMIALLGSQDRFGETKELINWVFENYQWKVISD